MNNRIGNYRKWIDKGNEARRAARTIKPGATQVIPDKRTKPPKHRKPLDPES